MTTLLFPRLLRISLNIRNISAENRTVFITLVALVIFSGLSSGCTLLAFGAVAVGESRRENSPEVRAQKEAAAQKRSDEIEMLKRAVGEGNEYAEIELAKKCFEVEYQCAVEAPAMLFKKYSDRGYEIATYYYASFRLGLNPFGHHITNCEKTLLGRSKCEDKKTGTELMGELAKKGCEYKVPAYQRLEWISPCSRLEQAK